MIRIIYFILILIIFFVLIYYLTSINKQNKEYIEIRKKFKHEDKDEDDFLYVEDNS